MHKWLKKAVMLAFAGFFILTFSGFGGQKTTIPDAQLVSAIKQRLQMDGRIEANRITVQAENGAITLGGVVDTMVEKVLAEGLVSNTIVGLRSVVNNISVRPAVIEEDALEREVKQNLLTTSALEGTSIKAAVRDGIVKLEGTVDSPAQRRVARKAAEIVDGVIGVIDTLKVAKTIRPDAEIEQEIALYLLWSPIVDVEQVDLEVKHGVVKLTGSVKHMAHVLTLEQDLEKVMGVTEVDVSGLQVQT